MVPTYSMSLIPLSHNDDTSSLSTETTEILSSTSSSGTGICRPNGNVQNQWSVSDYTRIDDVVELPDPGDGSSNSHEGFSESKIDIFDMTTQEEEKIIIAITIHLYCQCQITTGGLAIIESSYRFGSQGEWSSVKSVRSPFSMAWKSFTWDGLSVSKSQLDNLQIKLRAYISASGYGGWVQVDVMYVEVAYYVRPGEKIGVFMWCSEVGTQSIINQYKNVLIQKDYTTFFEYEDPGIYNVFPDIEDYDIPLDTIFFYFYGHGEYDSNYDNSYCYLRPGICISSQMLRYLMDTLEAERKGFLIEACYSGGFVDDFQDEPYLAMSSSSKNLPAYGYGSPPGEGVFSDYFWTFAGLGQNAVGAFTFARFYNSLLFWWPWQDPQIADYTTGYNFF